VEQIAKAEGFDDDLYGLCARGSAILWAELDKAGLKAEIVYNPGHVFVYCEGWYVDITATQFGLGKTVVMKESTATKRTSQMYSRHGAPLHPEWRVEGAWKRFTNPVSLKSWQHSDDWNYDKGIVTLEDLSRVKRVFKPSRVVEVGDVEDRQWVRQESMETVKETSLAPLSYQLKSMAKGMIGYLRSVGGIDVGTVLRRLWQLGNVDCIALCRYGWEDANDQCR
jgi:hypothetical protein